MSQPNSEPSKEFYVVPKIINGGIAGVVGITCIFPLDLVKTRLQSQQIGPDGRKLYSNMFDCFVKTFKSEGLIGMYRGALINIILVTPEKALRLCTNDFFRFVLTKPDGTIPKRSQFFAGAMAGFIPFLVSTPMELLKIQMQNAGRIAKMDGTVMKPPSTLRVIKKVIRTSGLFGFYKGSGATILRDVPFAMIYFPLFALLDTLGPRKNDRTDEAMPWVSFRAGVIAGAIAAVSATPADVIKTRLQALEKAKGEKPFNGIVDCFHKTIRDEGPTALFKGGLCRAIVIAPLFGIVNTVYFLGIGEWICRVEE